MSARISMGLDQLEQLVGALKGATAEITSRLDRLDEEVSTLRANWSGSAAKAYDDAQRASSNQLKAMNRILKDAGLATEQIVAKGRGAALAVERLWG